VKKVLAFSAIAFPIAAFGTMSQPSIATAQSAAPMNWSGFSASILGGGAWGNSSQSDNFSGVTGFSGFTGIGDGHYNMKGAQFGGGAGYNWQSGPWVAGIVADFSDGSVTGKSNTCGLAPGHPCGTKLTTFGTARGILGYANGQYLLYGTVGEGWGHIHAFDSMFNVSGGKTQSGVAFGGGIDYKLSQRTSLKIEYLHVDFGKAHLYDIVPGTPEFVSTNINIVRAGLTFYLP
jgi:outer membrane immunogenic protein